MRLIGVAIVMSVLLGLAASRSNPAGAQQPKSEPAKDESAKARIVPVILLRPGETKELLLSTACTVGVTRGKGLDVRETDSTGESLTSGKVWKRDGVLVEVPNFGDASKVADAPLYAPLKKQGLDAFIVKATAAKDAKPGLYELHLADFTCFGDCHTDLCVLVSSP